MLYTCRTTAPAVPWQFEVFSRLFFHGQKKQLRPEIPDHLQCGQVSFQLYNIHTCHQTVSSSALARADVVEHLSFRTDDASFPANFLIVYPMIQASHLTLPRVCLEFLFSLQGALPSVTVAAWGELYDASGAAPPAPAFSSIDFTDQALVDVNSVNGYCITEKVIYEENR